VPIKGRYVAEGAGIKLVLQRRSGERWVRLPLPTTTGRGGSFTTYIELGEPGDYRLRVRDPKLDVVSDVVTLTIA
jgi:hypothetical protein